MPRIGRQKTPGRWWWPRNQRDLGIFDIPTRFRGLFPQTFFGFPEFPSRSILARLGLQKSGGLSKKAGFDHE
jgi:hypothetical protein